MLLAGCVASGCVSMHRGPVAENVLDSRQLSLRGMAAVQRGRWSEAEELFARAIEVCPADELAHHRYAESLWRRGQRDAAIQHMETAVRLAGASPPLQVQLGEMYLSTGQAELARAQAEQAIAAQPQNETAWALQGEVLRGQGRMSEAMASYHRALTLRPHYPQVQLALCELYLQQNRPRRALATIDLLASMHPPNAVPQQVLALKGISLKRLGRHPDAVEALTKAVEESEPTGDLLLELAEAEYLSGNAAGARLALDAAISRGPANSRALELYHRLASAR